MPPELHVSDNLMVPDLVKRRLKLQLARAPKSVAGVVALTAPLPPGSSAGVRGDRQGSTPPGELVGLDPGVHRVEGALLARSELSVQVEGSHLVVEPSELMLDPGVEVFDPWAPIGPIAPASPLGRPVFTREPVVLFVLGASDLDRADHFREHVNRLIDRHVEARLATSRVPDGRYLFRPCLPVSESFDALRPDVVLAIDERARAEVPAWLHTCRLTTLVHVTDDLDGEVEWIPRRIGAEATRLNARVGQGISANDMAALAHRLVGGPPPGPLQLDEDGNTPTGVRLAMPRRRGAVEPERRSVFVASGPRPTKRMAALPDVLISTGRGNARLHVDNSAPSPSDLETARDADLLIVSGAAPLEWVDELVAERRKRGRPVMLEPAPTDLADLVGLAPTPTFTERVGVIRHVLVPSRGLGDLVDSLGGRPFRWNELSPIHTPAPDERPTEANAESPDDLSGDEGAGDTAGGGISAGAFQDGEFSIGVVADDAGSAHLATVFGALRRLGQTTDRTIGIELCGLAGAPLSEAAIAAGLVVGDHVRVIEETELDARRPDWSVQLWIPGAVETVFGSLEQIRAAGADAVPTATVDRLVDGAAGLVPDVLSISDGNSEKDWTASLELLLADPTLAPMLGQLAKRRTETLGGLRVAGSIIDRLWGWLQCH